MKNGFAAGKTHRYPIPRIDVRALESLPYTHGGPACHGNALISVAHGRLFCLCNAVLVKGKPEQRRNLRRFSSFDLMALSKNNVSPFRSRPIEGEDGR